MIVILIIITIQGCSSQPIKPTKSSTQISTTDSPLSQPSDNSSKPTKSMTSAATATTEHPFDPQDLNTPVPTVLPDQEKMIYDLLSSPDCKLPCYLGIKPGITRKEAEEIILHLGGKYHSNFRLDSGEIAFSYFLYISSSEINSEILSPQDINTEIFQHIDLVTKNDIVKLVFVSVTAPGEQLMDKYQKYWKRFTTVGVFTQLGSPNQIYLNKIDPILVYMGREISFDYKSRGVIVISYGSGKVINLCPREAYDSIWLQMILFAPKVHVDSYANYYNFLPLVEGEHYLPITDEIGISANKFYQSVMKDQSICFPVK